MRETERCLRHIPCIETHKDFWMRSHSTRLTMKKKTVKKHGFGEDGHSLKRYFMNRCIYGKRILERIPTNQDGFIMTKSLLQSAAVLDYTRLLLQEVIFR